MNKSTAIAVLVTLILATVFLGYTFKSSPIDAQFNLDAFAKLPVQHGGRIKPMDSLARTSLLMVSDKREFKDAQDNRQHAVRFLLDLKTNELGNRAVLDHKVIRIDNDALIDALGLEPRPGFYRYSLGELHLRRDALIAQIQSALSVEENERNLYQRKAVELSQQLDALTALATWIIPGIIPPTDPADTDWQSFSQGLHQEHTTGKPLPMVVAYDNILTSWARQDAAAFNAILAEYERLLVEYKQTNAINRAALEYQYNTVNPMRTSAAFYLVALLLVSFGWLGRWKPLMTSAAALVVLTFIIHTAALGIRMYLQGRPPVTNLYSSAVFVGWGTVLLGLILEYFYRNGIGTMMAAVTGLLTLIVAINLEIESNGETLDVLQAVLDTNFWLATHVTTVTIGYSATFLAGFLGILYLLGSTLTRRVDTENARALGRMIYGIICFALLFSFVGTVLGGIWADQSWGRFWGWDPKENGALMIVVWNALILHARWGGMIQQRGIAMLAVFGNIITAWSWFGTNMLGVGLHAYGFMDAAVVWMLAFVASQLLIIAIGFLPARITSAAKPTG